MKLWECVATIYRNNVKTLRFLENLRSTSTMCFTPELGNQLTDQFHFFTAAQLNLNILIFGFTSIFIKCGICQVFAQQVTICDDTILPLDTYSFDL